MKRLSMTAGALLLMFAPLSRSQTAPSAARLQATFSQGYAAGVQSQQALIQEMQTEIDRLSKENDELRKVVKP